MKNFVVYFSIVTLVIVGGVSIISAQEEYSNFVAECPDGEATVAVAGGAVGTELELGREQAARYMELCPNITVEFIEVSDSATDRLRLYRQFWEAESGDVDVFQVDVIWAGIIAPHMVDLNEYMSEDQIAQYFPAMIAGQTVDDRLVALPWFTDAPGLYYRTDLLEKYELDVPTTWDELEAAAMTIMEGEQAEGNSEFVGYVWQGDIYEGLTCDAHEWLASATGSTFITADGEVNVTDENWLALLDQAAGWVGTISPEAVLTFQEDDSRIAWETGNVAFMRNWPYAYGLGNAETSPIAGLFDYTTLPDGASGESFSCLGGQQLGVSRYSENTDAAVSVALFLTSPAEQRLRALSAFGANPTVPALYEDEEIREISPLFELMPPLLEEALGRPSQVTGDSYGEASELFFSAVHTVLTGQNDAATAMDALEIELEELLADLE